MIEQKFFDLCAKKLSGTISIEEEKEFSRYVDGNSEYLATYESLKKSWDISGSLRLKYQADPIEAWERFSDMKSKNPVKKVRWIHFATRLAAMIVLTIGLGFLLREFGKEEPYYYATANGETKWIVLADSSRIKLNENSLLTVSADFNEAERNVSLKGEALFEIKRDESRPFNIEANETKTQVLGTSFNIKALEDDQNVEIYVVSGKVSFGNAEENLILTEGMGASYSKRTKKLRKRADLINHQAWNNKTLSFQDADMRTVIRDLEDFFKVEIKLESQKLAECKFTGEFKDPNVEEVLKVICITLNVNYKYENDTYILQGVGRCQN